MSADAALGVAWHSPATVQDYLARHNDVLLGMVATGESVLLHDIAGVPDLPLARVHTPVLGTPTGAGALMFETWQSRSRVQAGVHGRVYYRHDGAVLFGSISVAEDTMRGHATDTPLAAATHAAYQALFETLAATGYTSVLRIWNYVPDIVGQRDGSERYWQFNSGRQAAFTAAGRHTTGDVPAACALGSSGGALTVFFLASRAPGIPIENPRQVSAFNYPQQYGPSSPTFARGLCVDRAGAPYLFISGTASIVGHESLHGGDVVLQTRETLANLRAVIDAANRCNMPAAAAGRAAACTPGAVSAPFALDGLSLRVYVHRPEDFEAVRAEIHAAFATDAPLPPILYVRAQVCRADLLVEIEASGGFPMAVAP